MYYVGTMLFYNWCKKLSLRFGMALYVYSKLTCQHTYKIRVHKTSLIAKLHCFIHTTLSKQQVYKGAINNPKCNHVAPLCSGLLN